MRMVLVLALLLAGWAAGATYYVDIAAGNDTLNVTACEIDNTGGVYTITKAGGFSKYVYHAGDQVQVISGTTVTAGFYTIVSATANALTISTDAGDSGGAGDASVTYGNTGLSASTSAGSLAGPMKNINAAVTAAAAIVNNPSTIYVKSGTYTEADSGEYRVNIPSGAADNALTFTAVADLATPSVAGSVVVVGSSDGSGALDCALKSGSGATANYAFTNFKFQGPVAKPTAVSCYYQGSNSGGTTTATFTNCEFENLGDDTGGYACINFAPTSGTLTLDTCTFHSAGAASDHQASITGANVIIRDCIFEKGQSGKFYLIDNCPSVEITGSNVQGKIDFGYRSRVIKLHDNVCLVDDSPVFGVNTTPSRAVYTVTGISQANPAVVTVSEATTSLTNGYKVKLSNVSGMTQINSTSPYEYFIVANKNDGAKTFELTHRFGGNVDSSGFTAYSGTYGDVQIFTPMAYDHMILVYNNYVDNTDPDATYENRGSFLKMYNVTGAMVYGNIIKNGGAQPIFLVDCVGTLVTNNYITGRDCMTIAGGRGNHVFQNNLIATQGACVWPVWSDETHNGLFTTQNTWVNNVMITDDGWGAEIFRGPIFYDGINQGVAGDDNEALALNYFNYNLYWSNDSDKFNYALFDQVAYDTKAEVVAKWAALMTYPLGNDVYSYFQQISRTSNFMTSAGIGKGMPRQINSAGLVTVKGDIGAVSGGGGTERQLTSGSLMGAE